MNIMVCYDGSDAAKKCMELARTHAKAFKGIVYLVESMEGGEGIPKEKFDRAEQELNEYAANFFRSEGVFCEPHLLVRGLSPGEDLVRFAVENEIDVMVIGVEKRSKVGKLLFGSTAQQVILEAPCPVLTVGK